MRSRLVGAAFALLTLASFASGAARAGCSGHAVSSEAGIDGLEIVRIHDEPGAGVPAVPEPRPGGCTGPSCSGRSGLPPAPATAPPPRIAQWAVLDAPPSTAPLSSSPDSPDDLDARPIRAADAIFHPPRLSSLVD